MGAQDWVRVAVAWNEPYGSARRLRNLRYADDRAAVLPANRGAPIWHDPANFVPDDLYSVPRCSAAAVFSALFSDYELDPDDLPPELQTTDHPAIQHGSADSPLARHGVERQLSRCAGFEVGSSPRIRSSC